jgi:hypothetical protein
MMLKLNPITGRLDFTLDPLSRRHILNAGENLTIEDYEQKLVYSNFTINGTGSLTINGSGELVILEV